MQTFSNRPEVQLRALNKLLKMTEEELGKGPAPFPEAPGKDWEVKMEQCRGRWELTAFHYRLFGQCC